jgi:hypothetical protein
LSKGNDGKANRYVELASAKVRITAKQRRKLERLWFIYGNGGPKMNYEDHGFIQYLLEQGRDARTAKKPLYKPTPECEAAVDAVLAKNKPRT